MITWLGVFSFMGVLVLVSILFVVGIELIMYLIAFIWVLWDKLLYKLKKGRPVG